MTPPLHGREMGRYALLPNVQCLALCRGFPFCFADANSLSCVSLIESYIDFEAPFNDPGLLSPRFAESAAPAAICCALDLAGMSTSVCATSVSTVRCRNGADGIRAVGVASRVPMG